MDTDSKDPAIAVGVTSRGGVLPSGPSVPAAGAPGAVDRSVPAVVAGAVRGAGRGAAMYVRRYWPS